MHPNNPQIAEIWLGYLLSVGLRGGVLLALAGLATLALRRGSASGRYLLWVAGFSALAVVTTTSWMLPAWQVEALPGRPLSVLAMTGDPGAAMPTAAASASGGVEAKIAMEIPHQGADSGSTAGPLAGALFGIWLTISSCRLLRLILGVCGAFRLSRRGIAADAHLLTLAATMARQMGLKRPVDLRLSDARLCRP